MQEVIRNESTDIMPGWKSWSVFNRTFKRCVSLRGSWMSTRKTD